MIVWLASFPRSGNTFCRMLLHHVYGLETYSIYNDPYFEENQMSGVVGQAILPAPVETLARTPEVYFVKTHDLPTDDGPALYLVRDGRDALVSYAHYTMKIIKAAPQPARKSGWQKVATVFKKDEDPFAQTLESVIDSDQYGGWSGNGLGWTRDRAGGRTAVVRYEDLVADPVGQMTRAAEELRLGIRPTGGRLPTFEELHAKDPKFFRKGKPGGWREEMPEALHERFWQRHAAAMDLFGYRR